MKTHRNILFISLFVGVISLLFVIILPQSTKGFQISLAFMGSSLISFLLELPNYISIRKDNYNNLYYSLYDLKATASILNSNIIDIFDNNIVVDKFYEQSIQSLSISINNLRAFDPNYYFSKRKNAIVSGIITSICNAFNNVKLSSAKYSLTYAKKELDIFSIEGYSRSITPNEMKTDLNSILENSNFLIELINKHAYLLFSKNQYKYWLIDESNLNNFNNNFKITQK